MSSYKLNRPVEILLVEDNPGDVRLVVEALKESKVEHNLYTAENGIEALAFLRKEGSFAQVPRPDLILLDLNMPKKNGREVLSEIKADDKFRIIPVLVLTISRAEEDIISCYKMNANAYINKPIDIGKFLKVIRFVQDFWLNAAVLPPSEG